MLPSKPLVEEVMSKRTIHALRMMILCGELAGAGQEQGRRLMYLLLLRQVLLGLSKWA
jgi:hypothetical protein